MPQLQVRRKAVGRQQQVVYTLEVAITSGPMTEAFSKENPRCARTIQIRGDQTLAQLHGAIFKAFDREDEHLYEFRLGGGPRDMDAPRYVHPMMLEEPFPASRKPAGLVTRTTIQALGLKVGQAFAYWFDFGDDWWHQITVLAVDPKAPPGRYPKLVNRVGESPPQYVDWEKESQSEGDDV